MFQLVFGQIIIILFYYLYGPRCCFSQSFGSIHIFLLTCWMEYEQKPIIFQRTKLIATADEVNCHWQSRRIRNLRNLFLNLWHFGIPCKPRHQTVTLSACLEWTSTWTNNWILQLYGHCSFHKTGIANSSSWIFQNSPFLDSCVSILDPRVLILAYQNSNITTVRRRESSFKDRVETVKLPLSCTAYRFSDKMKKNKDSQMFLGVHENLVYQRSW